jgi:hypothetical protein
VEEKTVKALIRVVVVAAMAGTSAQAQSLDEAQRLFYNGRYEASASEALAVRTADPASLAASELRSSALLFQLKRVFGEFSNKDASTDKAWKQCAACPAIMSAFTTETAHGQAVAKARLAKDPADEAALFYLGKLDLNYVWLQLGTLGHKTGWGEYWEARKSLDAVLKRNPEHVRARVARAWIDYIVDTKLPRGTKWLLGGGNKKRGLVVVREAAQADGDFYMLAEAGFALWDMQVREKNFTEALTTARRLSRDFPENQELTRFIARHDVTGTR